MVKVDVYEERLASAGIKLDQVRLMLDQDLLKVAGVGKYGLRVLREKYGKSSVGETKLLGERVYEALFPVLSQLHGVGKVDVRRLSRMVVAYVSKE